MVGLVVAWVMQVPLWPDESRAAKELCSSNEFHATKELRSSKQFMCIRGTVIKQLDPVLSRNYARASESHACGN